ncbi:hypothetical protein [Streptomyces flavofungini]|uniref:hypothetical protein n=1 Tax=Streptomyces flavofungini TaxID=68200 RepID=UPI0025B1F5E7|nr:hypothetical protein [Streptomyces flavofungini]WJV50841.1 hypothetical protein QUY26_38240 [Streptomyces flavofungini]
MASARAFEDSDPLGVRSEVGDVAGLRPLERPFDVALGVPLLNCAPYIAAMERTCRNVHRSSKPCGEFFLRALTPAYRFDGPPREASARHHLHGGWC